MRQVILCIFILVFLGAYAVFISNNNKQQLMHSNIPKENFYDNNSSFINDLIFSIEFEAEN